MSHRTSWRELAPGLIAAAATLLIAVAILVFARVGALHGRTDDLYAEVGEARGVLRGTQVWLNGQKVGLVKSIDFRAPDGDPARRLVMRLQVLHDYLPYIRRDSRVQIRSGSIIGAQVVYMSGGSLGAPVVADGDTLTTLPQADLEAATAEFAGAARQFPAIISNMKVLAAGLQSATGTLGAFGLEHGGASLARVGSNASLLMSSMSSGRGTVGRMLGARSDVSARARALTASADSIQQLLASPSTSLGRFRRDSTLLRTITTLRAGMDTVAAATRSPNGNLGRFAADSSVFRSMAQAQAALAILLADLQHHPLRYLHF